MSPQTEHESPELHPSSQSQTTDSAESSLQSISSLLRSFLGTKLETSLDSLFGSMAVLRTVDLLNAARDLTARHQHPASISTQFKYLRAQNRHS